jgi:hypothetical protein
VEITDPARLWSRDEIGSRPGRQGVPGRHTCDENPRETLSSPAQEVVIGSVILVIGRANEPDSGPPSDLPILQREDRNDEALHRLVWDHKWKACASPP